MPKKTRKKSSKTPSGKAARARPGAPARTSAGKAGGKTGGKTKAKTSTKKTVAKSARATPMKPHKPAKSATSKATRRTSNPASVKPAAKPSIPPAVTKLKTKMPAKSKAAPVKPDTAKAAAGKALATKADVSIAAPSALAKGGKAPAFRLPRDGGDTVSLADYSGKKLVLFFYPRADTPGCTKEAIDFTRLASAFAETGTTVLGVSADPLKAQESFRDKHGLSVPLVSDETHTMLNAYGVWGEKSMYGKVFHGVLRTTVLIDAGGRLARIWRHVKVDGHADEVLEAVRAI